MHFSHKCIALCEFLAKKQACVIDHPFIFIWLIFVSKIKNSIKKNLRFENAEAIETDAMQVPESIKKQTSRSYLKK